MSVTADNASPPLRFTGKALIFNGKTLKFSYPAVSGKQGRYNPIPAGTYWIATDEVYENGPTTDYLTKVTLAVTTFSTLDTIEQRHSAAWGRFRIPIHQSAAQQLRTGRSGMFIHGGTVPGSAGCIDLTEWIDVFVDHLRTEYVGVGRSVVPLIVE